MRRACELVNSYVTEASAVQPRPALKDLKEALSSARKPDITHVRKAFLIYTARPCDYGSVKYVRANFLRAISTGGYTGVPTPEDFRRFQTYLRAAVSHIYETLDAMEMHLANDPDLVDVEGMKRAAYAEDTDVTPGAKVGPSLLPHVAPACSSLMMAIAQAVACGLLPADPGTPWDSARSREMLALETLKHLRSSVAPVTVLTTPPAAQSADPYVVALQIQQDETAKRAATAETLINPVPGARW